MCVFVCMCVCLHIAYHTLSFKCYIFLLQIFDAFVVIGAFSMEVVFTVMGTEVVWEDAATFVIILRLWRVFTVCNSKFNSNSSMGSE